MLSRELGLKYIDTGATYRTLTLLALQNNIEPDDEPSILKLAQKSKIELESNPKDESQYTIVKLNGKDVTDDIRSSSGRCCCINCLKTFRHKEISGQPSKRACRFRQCSA